MINPLYIILFTVQYNYSVRVCSFLAMGVSDNLLNTTVINGKGDQSSFTDMAMIKQN